jgi:hypothetical protein
LTKEKKKKKKTNLASFVALGWFKYPFKDIKEAQEKVNTLVSFHFGEEIFCELNIHPTNIDGFTDQMYGKKKKSIAKQEPTTP